MLDNEENLSVAELGKAISRIERAVGRMAPQKEMTLYLHTRSLDRSSAAKRNLVPKDGAVVATTNSSGTVEVKPSVTNSAAAAP